MAADDWKSFTDQTNKRMAEMRKAHPAIGAAFAGMAKAAIEPGALDSKTKELIALAIGVAARCDGCLAFHVKAAARSCRRGIPAIGRKGQGVLPGVHGARRHRHIADRAAGLTAKAVLGSGLIDSREMAGAGLRGNAKQDRRKPEGFKGLRRPRKCALSARCPP